MKQLKDHQLPRGEEEILQEGTKQSKEKVVFRKSETKKRKEVQLEEPQQKRPMVEEAHSPTKSASVHDVEMFAQEVARSQPLESIPDNAQMQDMLSMSASHRPNQRQELPPSPEQLY